MSERIWTSIGPVTGTWFDIPKQSARVYVPFGKTRLNRMGLFYFRNHHWRRIEKSLDFLRLTASEEKKWVHLADGLKVFVERV
ncbi:MAG: hypothetical protein ISQ57_06525 [Litoricola sp.]|jgi:hypothetical protein|nr:hypothetical protein [Litorivicinus sp.]